MFNLESEMTPSMARWMISKGLQIKSEFLTPWGICDLVGLTFNLRNTKRRLKLKQREPIVSVVGAMLLQNLPEADSGHTATVEDLSVSFEGILGHRDICREIDRLKRGNYVIVHDNGSLQKLSGWMPIYKRFIAVELKLDRIDEALRQAESNLAFAPESYAAFPLPVAQRVAADMSRWSGYFNKGVGLIGVSPDSCRVFVRSSQSPEIDNPIVRFCSAEKFWRTRTSITDNSSLEAQR